MLTVDGSQGEGGGQILRSSLTLSLLTGRPVTIDSIRAKRRKPGLMRQHLTAVKAAAEVGRARLDGATIGSGRIVFCPDRVVPGEYHFSVGTAGSTMLVLQTVLPPLLVADGPSKLILEGGTHNPMAPPFDFLVESFLPIIRRMGATVSARLERPGFYPAGGGRCEFVVQPTPELEPFELVERGEIRSWQATATISNLPRHIAQRELNVIREKLGWDAACLHVREIGNARGPGNLVTISIRSDLVTEVFTGFGAPRVRAEAVASAAADAAARYLSAGVPVGEHLADQLLLPMVMARGGTFRTLPLSLHARTNIEVLRMFADLQIRVEEDANGHCLVTADG